MVQCPKCARGRHGDTNGSLTCSACSIGRAALSTGTVQCAACAVGTYSSRPANVACDACEHGKFNTAEGMLYCNQCGPGRYTNGTGQSECTLCAKGRFSSVPLYKAPPASECACNNQTNSSNAATAFCTYKRGARSCERCSGRLQERDCITDGMGARGVKQCADSCFDGAQRGIARHFAYKALQNTESAYKAHKN